MIKKIHGNIIDSDAQFIVHQCNCVSTGMAGLAKTIFKKYPYSDTYSKRNSKEERSLDDPGTISIHGNGKDKRYIVNFYSQYYPGKAKYKNDSLEIREKWFEKCLDLLGQVEDLKSVAFPYGIGCGLAGGDWDKYYGMIEDFSDRNPDTEIFIVNFTGV